MPVLYSFLDKVIDQIINPLILLMSAVAFVVFLWGIFQFIINADNDTKRSQGKQAIIWGLVGLVVIFGAYGIINTVLGTFNIPAIQR
jgi:hypothetical protein